jgi:hypothetical protein
MNETMKEIEDWKKTAEEILENNWNRKISMFRLYLRSKIADGDPLGLRAEFGITNSELSTLLRDALGETYTALEVSEKIGRSKVWIHRWSKLKNVGVRREADGVYIYTESDVDTLRAVETTRGRKKEDEKIKVLKH